MANEIVQNVLMCSEQYVKDNSAMDGNVDVQLIRTVLADAQELYILPILGTALYNDILNQIQSNTLSANYKTLVESYLQKALKAWTLYEGINIWQYKITNKAIMVKNSDNAQPVQTSDVTRLKEYFQSKAMIYSERCTKYLQANYSTYTLFLLPGTTIDTIWPNRDNYHCGIFLGNTTPKPATQQEEFENRFEIG